MHKRSTKSKAKLSEYVVIMPEELNGSTIDAVAHLASLGINGWSNIKWTGKMFTASRPQKLVNKR